jgi:hypothetical protein
VLLAFAIDYERESAVSLAIGANILRVLDEDPVRVRELPVLTGVSKEAISMANGYLAKNHLIIEDRWETRFGSDAIGDLRDCLGAPVGLPGAGAGPSPLLAGLTPYPDGWRAAVKAPAVLPHYPMVLHRGGFPDGS